MQNANGVRLGLAGLKKSNCQHLNRSNKTSGWKQWAYNFLRVFLALVLVHQLGILFAGGLVAKSGTDGGKGQEKGKVELHHDYI